MEDEAFGKLFEFFNLLLKALEKLFKALGKVARILHQKCSKRYEKSVELILVCWLEVWSMSHGKFCSSLNLILKVQAEQCIDLRQTDREIT